MTRYRLKELEIEGFRIFSHKQSVKIFNNLTVIYGRNGRGKTTLQDAISWLFNNDIPRYSEYNREWSRVKQSHIRSLLYPEISSSVKGTFERISDLNKFDVIRTEKVFNYDEEFDNWFHSHSKSDRLWANLLSQSKLQELALAKGRDRLENLAPLLDLTEINSQVKSVESKIREINYEINIKKTHVSEFPEENYNYLLERIEKIYFEISNTYRIESNVKFKKEMKLNESCKVWEERFKDLLRYLNESYSATNLKIDKLEYIKIGNENHKDKESSHQKINDLENELNKLIDFNKTTLQKINVSENNKKIIEKDIEITNGYNAELFVLENQIKIKDSNLEMIQKNIEDKNTDKNIHLKKIANDIKTLEELEKNCSNNEREMSIKNDFLMDCLQEIIINISDIEEIKDKIKKMEKELEEKQRLDYDQLIREFEEQIFNLGESNEQLVSKKKDLDDAFSILKEIDDDTTDCPLCGYEYNSKEKLKSSIIQKKEKWDEEFLTLGKELKNILSQLRECKRNRDLILFQKNQLIDEKNRLRNLIGNKELLEKKVLVASKKDDIETNDLDIKKIELIISLNRQELEALNDKKMKIFNKKNAKKEDFKKILNEIKSETEYLEELEKEVDELYSNKKNILQNLNDIKKKYNIKSEIKYTQINDELNLFLDRIIQEINGNNINLNSVDIKSLETRLFKNYQFEIKKISNSIDKVKEGLNLITSLKNIEMKLNDNYRVENEVSLLENELKSLKEERKNLREDQRIETNKEIGKISQRISMIFEMLSDVSPWRTIKSDAIVPDERERTNLIFRPIPKKVELNVNDYISKTNSNSTFAFSGGQLSLLGLSIFLSQVAESNESNLIENQLNTIFLDDPIQMLDTLRDDALISLLCDMARDRQIIISTSDIDFANKLILSSRPIWNEVGESCGVIHYEQLGNEGPLINRHLPEEWINSQRIYLPKLVSELK